MPASVLKEPERQIFQPDLFFLGRTQGRGVVRDFAGRPVDGCEITTDGRWDHEFGAMHFDEVFTFDSGPVDTLNWAFAPDPQGRMVASEVSVAAAVRGWSDGADYRLRFKRAGGLAPPSMQLTYDVRFSPMSQEVALKTVRLRLFGVPLAFMTAFHRRVPG
jgi:hypothetical protein